MLDWSKLLFEEVRLFLRLCSCWNTLLMGSKKCSAGLPRLLPRATSTQGCWSETSSFSCLLRTLARFRLPTVNTTELKQTPLFLSLSLSPALCGCVWDVVSGLKPIPLPWACGPPHTHPAPTHTQPALTLWTGPCEPNGSQRSGV